MFQHSVCPYLFFQFGNVVNEENVPEPVVGDELQTPQYDEDPEAYPDSIASSASQMETLPSETAPDLRNSVKNVVSSIRETFVDKYPDFCNLLEEGGNSRSWFSQQKKQNKIVNLGEDGPDNINKFSWWGTPLDLERETFSETRLKNLVKGVSSQMTTPPFIHLIDFKKEEFMTPKSVAESTLNPDLFASNKVSFKDSPFYKGWPSFCEQR